MYLEPKALNMKAMLNFANRFAFLLVVAALIFNTATAQNSKKDKEAKKAAETQKMIDEKAYVFKASYMTPMRGGGKALTSDYDMTIKNDTLISYLPYFGQSRMEAYGSDKGPLDFTSTKFDYKNVVKKDGSWEITINTKDNRDIQQIFLTVSPSGYATLHINSYNRDPISFDGYLEPVHPKKS